MIQLRHAARDGTCSLLELILSWARHVTAAVLAVATAVLQPGFENLLGVLLTFGGTMIRSHIPQATPPGNITPCGSIQSLYMC